jgi:hypothetical protein
MGERCVEEPQCVTESQAPASGEKFQGFRPVARRPGDRSPQGLTPHKEAECTKPVAQTTEELLESLRSNVCADSSERRRQKLEQVEARQAVSTSGGGKGRFRGITPHHGKWQARIKQSRRDIHLGYFDNGKLILEALVDAITFVWQMVSCIARFNNARFTNAEEEAARAYDLAAIRHRGKNTNLNFSLEDYEGLAPQAMTSPSRTPRRPPLAPSVANAQMRTPVTDNKGKGKRIAEGLENGDESARPYKCGKCGQQKRGHSCSKEMNSSQADSPAQSTPGQPTPAAGTPPPLVFPFSLPGLHGAPFSVPPYLPWPPSPQMMFSAPAASPYLLPIPFPPFTPVKMDFNIHSTPPSPGSGMHLPNGFTDDYARLQTDHERRQIDQPSLAHSEQHGESNQAATAVDARNFVGQTPAPPNVGNAQGLLKKAKASRYRGITRHHGRWQVCEPPLAFSDSVDGKLFFSQILQALRRLQQSFAIRCVSTLHVSQYSSCFSGC